jgi:competence protein ComGC
LDAEWKMKLVLLVVFAVLLLSVPTLIAQKANYAGSGQHHNPRHSEHQKAHGRQTQAQISYAQAGYDYRLALAMLQYQTTGI